MPIYDFHCETCDKKFDDFAFSFDESGAFPDIKCPQCRKSENKKMIIGGGFNFAFTNPVGTDRWNSDGKGHDYRFKYNAPKVKAGREFATANSHMGGTEEIYGKTQAEADLNVDANWGEVK